MCHDCFAFAYLNKSLELKSICRKQPKCQEFNFSGGKKKHCRL